MFLFIVIPRVVASSNPGLKLANAFGVSILTRSGALAVGEKLVDGVD